MSCGSVVPDNEESEKKNHDCPMSVSCSLVLRVLENREKTIKSCFLSLTLSNNFKTSTRKLLFLHARR